VAYGDDTLAEKEPAVEERSRASSCASTESPSARPTLPPVAAKASMVADGNLVARSVPSIVGVAD
jgi:hypothetical protein